MKVRKFLAILVCACMLVGMLPAAVFADGGSGPDWLTITSYQAADSAKGKTIAVGGTLSGATDVSFYVAAYSSSGQLLAVSDTVNMSAAGQWVCSIDMTAAQYAAFKELKTFIVSSNPDGVTPEKAQAELRRITSNLTFDDRDAFLADNEPNTTWLIEEGVNLDVKTDIDLAGAIINKGIVNILEDGEHDIHGEIRVNGTIVNDGVFNNEHAMNVNGGGTFVNNGEYNGALNEDGNGYESWFSVNSGGTLIANENMCDNVMCQAEFDSEGNLVMGVILGDGGFYSRGDDEEPDNEYFPQVLLTVRSEEEFATAISSPLAVQIKPEGFILNGNYELRNGKSIYVEREMWDSTANEGNGGDVPNTFTLKDGSRIDAYQGTNIQFNNVLTLAGEITLHDDAELRFFGGDNDASATNTFAATSAITLRNNSWAELRGTTDFYGDITIDDQSRLKLTSGDGNQNTDVKTFTLKSGSSLVNNSILELRGENGAYMGVFNDPNGCYENNGQLSIENFEFNRPGFVTTRQQLKDALNSSEDDIEIFVMFNSEDEQPMHYDMNSLESDGEFVLTVPEGKNVVITGIESFDWGNNYIKVHGVIVREGASLELRNMDIRLADPDSYLILKESETSDNGGRLTLTDATVEVDDNDWSPEAEDHTTIEVRKNACLEIGSPSVGGRLNFNGEIHNAGTIFAYSEFNFDQHNYFEGENGIIFETKNINNIADKVSRDLNGIKTLAVEGLSNDPASLKAFQQNVIEPEQWTRWIEDHEGWDDPHYDDIYGMAVLIGIGAVTAPAEGYLDLSQPLDFQQIRNVLEAVAKVATGSETISEGELKNALDAYYDGEGDPRMHFWGGLRQNEDNKWVEWEFDTLFENYKNALMLALPAEDSEIENIVISRVTENDGWHLAVTVDGEEWDGDEFVAYNFTKPVTISCDPADLPHNESYVGNIMFRNCSFPEGVTLQATDAVVMTDHGSEVVCFDVDFTDSCSGIVNVASPAGYPDGGDFRIYTDDHYGAEPPRIGVGGATGLTIYADNYTSINARGTVNVNGLTIDRGTYPENRDMNIDVRWDYNGEDDDYNPLVIHTIEVDTDDAYDNTQLVVISTAEGASYNGKLRIAGGVDISGVKFTEDSWAELSDCKGNNYFILGGNHFHINNGSGNVTLNGGVTESDSNHRFALVNGAELTSRNNWAEFSIYDINLGRPHIFGENGDYNIFLPTTSTALEYTVEQLNWGENDVEYYVELDFEPDIITKDGENKTHLIADGDKPWIEDPDNIRLTVEYNGCTLVIEPVMFQFVNIMDFAHRFFGEQAVSDNAALLTNPATDDDLAAEYAEWTGTSNWPDNADDSDVFARFIYYTGLEPECERFYNEETHSDDINYYWDPYKEIRYDEAKRFVEGLYKEIVGREQAMNLSGHWDYDEYLHFDQLNEFVWLFNEALNVNTVSTWDNLIAALAGEKNTIEIVDGNPEDPYDALVAQDDVTVPVGKKLIITEGAALDMKGHDFSLADGYVTGVDIDHEREEVVYEKEFASLSNGGIINMNGGKLTLGYLSELENDNHALLSIDGDLLMKGEGTAMLASENPDDDPLPLCGYYDPSTMSEPEFRNWDQWGNDDFWFDIGDGAYIMNSGNLEFDGASATIQHRACIDAVVHTWEEYDEEKQEDITVPSLSTFSLVNGTEIELGGSINICNHVAGGANLQSGTETLDVYRSVMNVSADSSINMDGGSIRNHGEITLFGTITMENEAFFGNDHEDFDGEFTGGILSVGTAGNKSGSIVLLTPGYDYDENDELYVFGRSEFCNNGVMDVWGSITDTGCWFNNYGNMTIHEDASFTETCIAPVPNFKGSEYTAAISRPFTNGGILNIDGLFTIGDPDIPTYGPRLAVEPDGIVNFGINGRIVNNSTIYLNGSECYVGNDDEWHHYEDNSIHVFEMDMDHVDGEGLLFINACVRTCDGLAKAAVDTRFTDIYIEDTLELHCGDVGNDSIVTDKYVTIDWDSELVLDGVTLTINDNWIENYGSITLLNGATITIVGGEGTEMDTDYGFFNQGDDLGLSVSKDKENGIVVIRGTAAFGESWDGIAGQLADPDIEIIGITCEITSAEAETTELIIPRGKSVYIADTGSVTVTDGYKLILADGDTDPENYSVEYAYEFDQVYLDTSRAYVENHGTFTLESGGSLDIGKLNTFENSGSFSAQSGSEINIAGSTILERGVYTMDEEGKFLNVPTSTDEDPDDGWEKYELSDGAVLNNHDSLMTIAGTLNIAPFGSLNNYSGIDEQNGFACSKGTLDLAGTGNIYGSINNEIDRREFEDEIIWSPSEIDFTNATYTFHGNSNFDNRGKITVDTASALTFTDDSCFNNWQVMAFDADYYRGMGLPDSYAAELELAGTMTFEATKDSSDKEHAAFMQNMAVIRIMENGSFVDDGCFLLNIGEFAIGKDGTLAINGGAFFLNIFMLDIDGDVNVSEGGILAQRGMLIIGENAAIDNDGSIFAGISEAYDEEQKCYTGVMPADKDPALYAAAVHEGSDGALFWLAMVATEDGLIDACNPENGYHEVYISGDLSITKDITINGMNLGINQYAHLSLINCNLTMTNCGLTNDGYIDLQGISTITISGTEFDEDFFLRGNGNNADLNVEWPDEDNNSIRISVELPEGCAYVESWDDLAVLLADEETIEIGINGNVSSEDSSISALTVPVGKTLYVMPWSTFRVTDGYSLTLAPGDTVGYTVELGNEDCVYLDTPRANMENYGSMELESGASLTIGLMEVFENHGSFHASTGSTVTICGSKMLEKGLWSVNGSGEVVIDDSYDECPDDMWDQWIEFSDGGTLNNYSGNMEIAGNLVIQPYGNLRNCSGFDDDNNPWHVIMTLSGEGIVYGIIENGLDIREREDDILYAPAELRFEGADYTFDNGVFINRGQVYTDETTDLLFTDASYMENSFWRSDNWGYYEAKGIYDPIYPAEFFLLGDMTLQIRFNPEDPNDFGRTYFYNYGSFFIGDDSATEKKGTLTDNGCITWNSGFFVVDESGTLSRTSIPFKEHFEPDENIITFGRAFENKNMLVINGIYNLSEYSYFNNFGDLTIGGNAVINNNGSMWDYYNELNDNGTYLHEMPGRNEGLASAISEGSTGELYWVAYVGSDEGFLDAVSKGYNYIELVEEFSLEQDMELHNVSICIGEKGGLTLNDCTLTIIDASFEGSDKMVLDDTSSIIVQGQDIQVYCDTEKYDVEVITEGEPEITRVTIRKKAEAPEPQE